MTYFLSILSQITLEPIVFLNAVRRLIDDGAQITTNLLIDKICHIELNYSDEICANLTNDGFSNYTDEVQQHANNFLMVSQWLGGVPAVVYSLFAGSLLDKFGCKPFIILPLIGALLSEVCLLINFAFIENLPIQFFYVESIYSLFGGKSVFYLGTYAYGSLNFPEKSRASALTRYDGLEVIGKLIATLLAPIVLLNIGCVGNYSISIGSTLLAILYTLIFIQSNSPSSVINRTVKNVFMDFLVTPLVDMLQCLFRRRPKGVHWLIAIQVYAFASYWFVLEEKALKYLFMLKIFDGFDQTDYSWYFAYETAINTVGLLVIFPTMSNFLHIHDTAMLAICVGLESLGNLKSFIYN